MTQPRIDKDDVTITQRGDIWELRLRGALKMRMTAQELHALCYVVIVADGTRQGLKSYDKPNS